MTELQTVELNLLKELLALCEKLSLRSYLVCGSALGAVKYGGFIPWDDDIDVALPRPDYERFCAEAPAYLPDWCFLQNYRSEPLYYLLGSKLRDSRTTYMEQMAERLPIHHGVFIDVFPLDGKWSSQTDDADAAHKSLSLFVSDDGLEERHRRGGGTLRPFCFLLSSRGQRDMVQSREFHISKGIRASQRLRSGDGGCI